MLRTSDKDEENIIPPKVRHFYSNFKLISEANYFTIFSATSNSNNQRYTIRVLNFKSDFYAVSSDIATTLFIQELLRLCSLHPDSVIIEHFEICDRAIAFVTAPYLPVDSVINTENGHEKLDIEKMMRDVLADIYFLANNMKLSSTHSSIQFDFDNIYQFSDAQEYILGDWAKGLNRGSTPKDVSVFTTPNSPDGDVEMRALAIKILEFIGANPNDLKDLMGLQNPRTIMAHLEIIFNGLTETPENIKKILKSILTKEPGHKLKLPDFVKSRRKDAEETKKESEPPVMIKQVSKTLGKVSRFTETTPGSWGYNKELNIDGITFKTTKDIQITGIGLYVPLGSDELKGKVKILEGASSQGEVLTFKDVSLRNDMPEVENSIYVLRFEKVIEMVAGKTYSIVSEFEKGPQTIWGKNGEKSISINEHLTFEFSDCGATNNGTSVQSGLLPEIYFSY